MKEKREDEEEIRGVEKGRGEGETGRKEKKEEEDRLNNGVSTTLTLSSSVMYIVVGFRMD